MATADKNTVLIVGASRGLGLEMAEEFARRGWNVIATGRQGGLAQLEQMTARYPYNVTVETVDIDAPDQIAALRERLSNRRLDILFVNAGVTTHDPMAAVGDVSTEEYANVMTTNALSPLRVIGAFQDLVLASGLIGAMSSGQGSITNNDKGTRDVYRASKAALNMLMRSFAASEAGQSRAIVLIAPGWVRTDLGGSQAPFSMEEVVPRLADVLIAKRNRPGLEYLDRFGDTVPW